MNTTYKGKNLMVFVNGVSIALATSHTLGITINTTDITTKDSVGKFTDTETTNIQWQITSENLCSFGTDGKSTIDILDLALAGNKVTLKFGLCTPLDSGVPTGGFTPNATASDNIMYTGDAIITSVNLTANNGERATYQITFTGTGELSKVTA